jgi:hypothetical protein
MKTIKDLFGKSLEGFTIQALTEVYKVNDDGIKSQSLGFFHDDDLAKAFAGNQIDAPWHKTEKAFVLTNGETGFLIGEPVILLNDEKAALEVKKKILSKLSKEDRRFLRV